MSKNEMIRKFMDSITLTNGELMMMISAEALKMKMYRAENVSVSRVCLG